MCVDRKAIIGYLFVNLEHLSNLEYQKRVWINGIGPECDNFDEATCNFTERAEAILHERYEFELTDKQYLALKNFYLHFDAFSSDHNHPEEFITTSEWIAITQEAKEVLKIFNYQPPEKKS